VKLYKRIGLSEAIIHYSGLKKKDIARKFVRNHPVYTSALGGQHNNTCE
jgi:hypothetical protein